MNRCISRILSVVTALAASVALASPAVAGGGSEWRLVDLGVLPGDTHSSASAINDRGTVVGVSSGEMGSPDRAFVWRKGRMTELAGLGSISFPTDVNNRGDVVGYSGDVFSTRAVMWSNGRVTDLGSLGGGFAMATAVNERRQVVGFSWAADGQPHAFSWKDGVMTDLGTGTGYSSDAVDVNERGDILGTVSVEGFGGQPVIWRHGVARPFMDESVGVSALNDRGQVVGFTSGLSSSFVWSARGITEIPVPPDHVFLQMQGINNRGQVVGYSDYVAWFWEDGRMTQLPSFQPIGVVAMDINDRSQVVGSSATTPDGQQSHAVMWTR